jgi:hypothetical protein
MPALIGLLPAFALTVVALYRHGLWAAAYDVWATLSAPHPGSRARRFSRPRFTWRPGNHVAFIDPTPKEATA